ncbi:prephenate dehydrogenase/arogenate dehydrogenase family protein [Lachnospiraceae bacterium HCP1S3_C3]|nr:prephenate dehydrogenase [Lachnospiraceae bacterium]
MKNLTIGFVGLGLIGGSIAKGIRYNFPEFKIVAYNRSEAARNAARLDGTADIICADIDNSFSECDYIFLCTPVEYNVEYLRMLKPIIKSSCIISDVGSTKTNIHEAVTSEHMEANFIGGHPMAGSEKTGYENASEHLIENAFFAITPTSLTTPESLAEFKEIVSGIGGIPVVLDYAEHDYCVAAISHLPHLVAAGLVNLVKDSDSPSETMKLLAAGGFKDITRIASSSPEMWQQICTTNGKNISDLLGDYITSLTDIKNAIDNNESSYIFDLFTSSRAYRNSFSDIHTGPIPPVYKLYCDIIDKSGAILAVATILSTKDISIKNIGIINNREREAGVLEIVFYNKTDLENASLLLKEHNYKIY